MFSQIQVSLTDHSYFGDTRLSKRFGRIVEQIGSNFGQSLPRCGGTHTETQALYRFMSNEKVTACSLYESEGSRLKERLESLEDQTFLIVSDKTELDYSTTKSRHNLDCLDSDKRQGLYTQSAMLMNMAGCPEGLIRQIHFNRPAAEVGSSRQMASKALSEKPIEDKESYEWLADLEEAHKLFGQMRQHRFVHITDREGDIFERFAAHRFDHIYFLSRLKHDRSLVDSELNLKAFIAQIPPQGCISLAIKDQKTGEKRLAKLEISFATCTIDVPAGLKKYQKEKGYQPLKVQVIQVKEVTQLTDPLKSFEPLFWLLLTSLPVEDLEQALEVIHFYTLRWRIEDFHVVLKQGARIEKLQFEQEHQLINAIITYSIVAIQVLRLRYLNEATPNLPIQETEFTEQDVHIAVQYLNKVRNMKIQIPQNPTIAFFCQLLALIATGNKKNTGFRALWKGYREFSFIKEIFKAKLNSS
jgi:hypothetical protein